MGCDIHVYTERKQEDGSWFCCDHFKLNKYYGKYENEPEYFIEPIYNDRNYSLFATLADVRNYNHIKPIDEPRGLPVDISDGVKKEADHWKDDAHSYSWFLASELFAYKTKHPFYKVSGMVSPTDAFYLDELGRIPSEWCEYTSNESYVRREWLVPDSVLDKLINAIKHRMDEEFYICDWYSEAEKEAKYMKHAKDFRIVFWFDN